MSRRVCAIFGRADGQKTFAARVVEAVGIGRLKAVRCGNAISATTGFSNRRNADHRSRFPLKEWFGPYLWQPPTLGMSATQLALRWDSYKTA
jgi:hypothetical protein